MELTHILLAPVITEKSSRNQEKGKYTFRVHQDSNKIQVAKAVKATYGVDVDSVRVLNIQRKYRLVGRGKERTKRLASKRAFVTLKPNQTIDFNKVKTTK